MKIFLNADGSKKNIFEEIYIKNSSDTIREKNINILYMKKMGNTKRILKCDLS
jgi:hypothetical protein